METIIITSIFSLFAIWAIRKMYNAIKYDNAPEPDNSFLIAQIEGEREARREEREYKKKMNDLKTQCSLYAIDHAVKEEMIMMRLGVIDKPFSEEKMQKRINGYMGIYGFKEE